jgi:hypothetical protein
MARPGFSFFWIQVILWVIYLHFWYAYIILAYQMKPSTSRLRQLIREIEHSRAAHVQGILQEKGPLRSGSLVTIRRKCGKPNCHCATGEGHRTTYLSTKQGGKTRMVYVPADCLETLTWQAHSYRRLRKHRASLAKLSQESLQLIDRLQVTLQTTNPIVAAPCGGGGAKRKQTRGDT